MAQHDYILDNQSGASFRSDINGALAAIVSTNSGTAAPTTTYAYMMWADTTNGRLKIRNGANSAWIDMGDLASAGLGILGTAPLGTVTLPSFAFTGDNNTGIYSPAADQLAITTGGVQRLNITTAALLPTLPVRGADGTAANPAYSFSGDTDVGIYRITANTLSLVTNGLDRFVAGPSGQLGIGGTTYGTLGQVLTSGGSAAAPTWSTPTVGDGGITAAKLDGGQSGSAPIYGARAWVNFNGTGTVAIRASGNVSSITDNGTGNYTVNFTTAMPDANYSAPATANNLGSTAAAAIRIGTYLTSSVRLYTTGFNTTDTDFDTVNVTIFR